jgi:hypothetical protein
MNNYFQKTLYNNIYEKEKSEIRGQKKDQEEIQGLYTQQKHKKDQVWSNPLQGVQKQEKIQ